MNINPRCILNSIHICCFVLTASMSMYRDGGEKRGAAKIACNKYTNNLRRIDAVH